jgi:hypothetical protein
MAAGLRSAVVAMVTNGLGLQWQPGHRRPWWLREGYLEVAWQPCHGVKALTRTRIAEAAEERHRAARKDSQCKTWQQCLDVYLRGRRAFVWQPSNVVRWTTGAPRSDPWQPSDGLRCNGVSKRGNPSRRKARQPVMGSEAMERSTGIGHGSRGMLSSALSCPGGVGQGRVGSARAASPWRRARQQRCGRLPEPWSAKVVKGSPASSGYGHHGGVCSGAVRRSQAALRWKVGESWDGPRRRKQRQPGRGEPPGALGWQPRVGSPGEARMPVRAMAAVSGQRADSDAKSGFGTAAERWSVRRSMGVSTPALAAERWSVRRRVAVSTSGPGSRGAATVSLRPEARNDGAGQHCSGQPCRGHLAAEA